jgi:hypothetical protein
MAARSRTWRLQDSERYAAFFELHRLKTVGSNAVQLMVQSAYVLDPARAAFARFWWGFVIPDPLTVTGAGPLRGGRGLLERIEELQQPTHLRLKVVPQRKEMDR